MSYLLSAAIQTLTFSSGSPIQTVPVGDPTRRSHALLRAEADDIWIGEYSAIDDFPAATSVAFRLLNGVEYHFTFEPAQLGDEDPNLYATTTSDTDVVLSFVITYEGV